MSLWPHPTIEESFAELMKIDEAWRAKQREIDKAIGELKNLHAELSDKAAYTIRIALTQRNIAEQKAEKAAQTEPTP